MSEPDIELPAREGVTPQSDEPEAGHSAQSLPRADGGRQAWTVLACCFLVEALIWGFPLSYGEFQAYYRKVPNFAQNKAGIAAVGTTQTGLIYFGCPIASIVFQRWLRLRRPAMCIGAVVMVVGVVAGSFADNVPFLIATQGVMYALGGLVLWVPSIQYIDEWFIARRGVAYGVMWAGTAAAGIFVPFLVQWLLDDYGFRTALRVWAVMMATGLTPCLIFAKGRLPITDAGAFRPLDLRFLKQGAFWLFEFGTIMQSLANFLPFLWLPSFSEAIGLPKFAGPAGLALIAAAGCCGTVATGWLIDRVDVSVSLAVSTIGQMLCFFLLWGLAKSQAMVFVFALGWGLFGGAFSVTWSGYAAKLQSRTSAGNVDTAFVLTLMAAGRGIGAVLSGPLSETLLESGWKLDADSAYGTAYGSIIIFGGLTATLGGAACLGKLLRLL